MNEVPTIPVNQEDIAPHSRSTYGKISLSEAEKGMLYKAFPDPRDGGNIRKAWTVAIICMKHRLNRSEIKELIAHPPDDDRFVASLGKAYLGYNLGMHSTLDFTFDEDGNLTRVYAVGVPYKLPPMELVTPDTPTELPPLPSENPATLQRGSP